MANPGEITIIAQAPLTNIAACVVQEPGFARAVKHLWIMGGTDNGIGNVTPAAEYNFYADPEAAKIVFAAGFSLSLVTWTLTLQDSLLTEAELAGIAALGTPLSAFFGQVNAASVAFSRARYGNGSTVHPDSLTCACALDESLVLEASDCFIDIETTGQLTRGYCSVSSDRLPEQEIADPALGAASRPNARVIRRADREGFRDRVVEMLRG
jgi:purine nucleosidase